MTTETAIASNTTRTRNFVQTPRLQRMDHRFYTIMAFALTLAVFAGFFRTYYAGSYFHSPALPFWVHVHGAVFTAWMLFYVLQNLLAMNGRMMLHRNLGIVGLALAAGVVVMGTGVAVRQARHGRFFPFPDTASLLAISFGQMALFAGLIAAGLLLRREGETHKRLMLMAPQLFIFPALGRLLQGINPTTLLLALCFYAVGPVYDFVTRRSVHPAYKWGVPLLVLTMPPFGVLLSHAPIWRHFSDWLVR